MNTSKTSNELISAFADGELDASQHEPLVKTLRDPAARDVWDAYHLVGDTLRSSDSAVTFSAGFSERMAARLDAEPIFLASPAKLTPAIAAAGATRSVRWSGRARRLAAPGAAMAATVLIAVAAGPRLLNHSERIASSGRPAGVVAVATLAHNDQTVLRNPQIDEYLDAHQRFSPSLYSTAQYARPSSFATESVK